MLIRGWRSPCTTTCPRRRATHGMEKVSMFCRSQRRTMCATFVTVTRSLQVSLRSTRNSFLLRRKPYSPRTLCARIWRVSEHTSRVFPSWALKGRMAYASRPGALGRCHESHECLGRRCDCYGPVQAFEFSFIACTRRAADLHRVPDAD